MRVDPDETFPFSDYRDYQRAALYEASHALFTSGVETVVLNLPTGIGKSPINTALARQAESTFMTTPQKALRTQLEEDEALRDHYEVLRAREDYTCTTGSLLYSGDYDCSDCPINRDDEESCLVQDECPYWSQKELAMAYSTAVLTFSYLIVDGYLPKFTEMEDGGQKQVSFGDRELLIVDECHKLEDQVASLHAGISVSPYSLPERVFQQIDREIGELPDDEATTFEDKRMVLDRVYDRADAFIQNNSVSYAIPAAEESKDVRDCKNFVKKYEYCRKKSAAGRDWVVGREEITYNGQDRHKITIQPVDVDEFLQDHVWSRAEKQVLSTATMPFSGNPGRWLRRLGLDPHDARVIQYPMAFPEEHRQIHTDCVVAKMSQGGYAEHKDAIVDQIRTLARAHAGEKGLIHTASYTRANELSEYFPDNAVCHDRFGDLDLRAQIDRWQYTDADMFFSPAATDGVDLPYDDCRWQVLVKVPYPQPSDPRVRFLLDERRAWDWYYEMTCQDIQQSVGRGVRSDDDRCDYYVLDASFFDVMDRASAPEWFTDAITKYDR